MPIRWDALKQHRREAPWLVLDLFVLALITVNLVLLLADTLLLNSGAGLLLGRFQPELITAWRTEWHHPVWLYDTILTGFLIGELALRWAVAVYGRTYHRWFFYPFIHWYDVLGCLPGLQALRLFRLVTVFYRLNRMGLLLIGGGLIITARKYYNIVLEEISDRIVLNVLEGVRQEIRRAAGLRTSARAHTRPAPRHPGAMDSCRPEPDCRPRLSAAPATTGGIHAASDRRSHPSQPELAQPAAQTAAGGAGG